MTTYTVHPHQIITDSQREQLLEDGFLILPRFIPEDELPELQAAQRRVLRTWDEVRADPPSGRSAMVPYPHGDARAARHYFHPELLRLGRWWLRTDHVLARVGMMIARYPGFVTADAGHIDNANNSLLPMSESAREFGQIGFWIHLEEVGAGEAPLRLVRRRDGDDVGAAVPLVCAPGTIAVFTNYTVHAASTFTADAGQRFTWGYGLGRADHVWEGFHAYTMYGTDPAFRAAVSAMSPDERALMSFPAVGHRYYTAQTLAALERQYPGWDATGAYAAALRTTADEASGRG
ncbi:MAG TPA: phytanoyl-CoA dioxygenase family protein [Planctomycetota bacterium]|nr:phytanoyl-CoA dioxygenase family protein [Planctomycetota bacterium]